MGNKRNVRKISKKYAHNKKTLIIARNALKDRRENAKQLEITKTNIDKALQKLPACSKLNLKEESAFDDDGVPETRASSSSSAKTQQVMKETYITESEATASNDKMEISKHDKQKLKYGNVVLSRQLSRSRKEKCDPFSNSNAYSSLTEDGKAKRRLLLIDMWKKQFPRDDVKELIKDIYEKDQTIIKQELDY